MRASAVARRPETRVSGDSVEESGDGGVGDEAVRRVSEGVEEDSEERRATACLVALLHTWAGEVR